MRSSESLLLFIFSEVSPLLLLLPVMVEGVAYRMVEMSPTKEEAVGSVRRDDVIWGGGKPDHADTTLLLLEVPVVVVMIGEEVVVKRSNTLRLMLDLVGWPLVLVIVKYCSVDSCLCVEQSM